jgi:hypothetical protein
MKALISIRPIHYQGGQQPKKRAVRDLFSDATYAYIFQFLSLISR